MAPATIENQQPSTVEVEAPSNSDHRDQPVIVSSMSDTRPIKCSPTPSVKRGKAEKLLKEHGSPPGMRVTAGGHIIRSDGLIIPTDSAAIGSPPGVGHSGNRETHPDRNRVAQQTFASAAKEPRTDVPNGTVSELENGQLCQFVDGRFLPLDYNNGVPALYMAAPNYPFLGTSINNTDAINNTGAIHNTGAPPQAFLGSGYPPIVHSVESYPTAEKVYGHFFLPPLESQLNPPYLPPYILMTTPYQHKMHTPTKPQTPARPGSNKKSRNTSKKQDPHAQGESANAATKVLTPEDCIKNLNARYDQMSKRIANLRREEVLQEDFMTPVQKRALVDQKRTLTISMDQHRKAVKQLQNGNGDTSAYAKIMADDLQNRSQTQLGHRSGQRSQDNHQEIEGSATPMHGLPIVPQFANLPYHMPAPPALGPARHFVPQGQIHPMQAQQMPMAAYPQAPQPYHPPVNYGPVATFQHGGDLFVDGGVHPGAAAQHGYYQYAQIGQDLFAQHSQHVHSMYGESSVHNTSSVGGVQAGQSPVSFTTRFSHALEIKPPQEESTKVQSPKSLLNPTSPEYEPRKTTPWLPPSPPMIPTPEADENLMRTNPWLCENLKSTASADEGAKKDNKSSRSSIATSDFFPHNPAEHSSNSYPIHANETGRASANVVGSNKQKSPVTPRMPRSPWNASSGDENSPAMLRSEAYKEGYRMGLNRRTPMSRFSGKDYDAGYCAGFMRSRATPDSGVHPMLSGNLSKRASSASAGKAEEDEEEYFECSQMPRKNLSTGDLARRTERSRTGSGTNSFKEQVTPRSGSRFFSSGSPNAFSGYEEPNMVVDHSKPGSIWSPQPHDFQKTPQKQRVTSTAGLSPLATQQSGNQVAGTQLFKGPSQLAFGPQSPFSMSGQQQVGKSASSVAPASDHARGVISQFDGAMDDLAEMMNCNMPPSKPVASRVIAAKASGKQSAQAPLISTSPEKSPSRSPFKASTLR